MSSRRYDTVELIRKKTSMSQQISKTDSSYGLYSGAMLEDAFTMSLLNVITNLKMFPGFEDKITFLQAYLNERRKAFFASTSTEITKLGFILGWKGKNISAKNTRADIDKLTEPNLP